MADQYVHQDDTFPRPAAAPKSASVAGWPYPQYAQKPPVYHRGDKFPEQDWPYEQKTAENKEIYHTFNDGHYHSPRHVWERSEKAPTGASVNNWPETSPPKDEAPAKKALIQGDDDSKEGGDAAEFKIPSEPEKVHTIMPTGHQAVANSNEPGPRTTFYADKSI
jgi:hypothetical protein